MGKMGRSVAGWLPACLCMCVCMCIFRCDLSPYGVGLSRGTGGEPYTCYQSELLASSHWHTHAHTHAAGHTCHCYLIFMVCRRKRRRRRSYVWCQRRCVHCQPWVWLPLAPLSQPQALSTLCPPRPPPTILSISPAPARRHTDLSIFDF